MIASVRRNRAMFNLCNYRFLDWTRPWWQTYCRLHRGHEGPHEPHNEPKEQHA